MFQSQSPPRSPYFGGRGGGGGWGGGREPLFFLPLPITLTQKTPEADCGVPCCFPLLFDQGTFGPSSAQRPFKCLGCRIRLCGSMPKASEHPDMPKVNPSRKGKLIVWCGTL